jgi:hypothetical protein
MVTTPFDDHFLQAYRELLDAEDAAFDELEHSCEDGDRGRFDKEMELWKSALEKKLTFLQHNGVELPVVALS